MEMAALLFDELRLIMIPNVPKNLKNEKICYNYLKYQREVFL